MRLDKRSVDTLMEVQAGAGPFARPAMGYVHLGEQASVVFYVQGTCTRAGYVHTTHVLVGIWVTT